jgi:ABC-type Zn uptake system ZnuABC Zn-binding protein ZnuA
LQQLKSPSPTSTGFLPDFFIRVKFESILTTSSALSTAHLHSPLNFSYFGAAYGLRFIAPQGISTDAAPSAQAVARIIRQIRQEKIPAVFLENVADPRLAERIAQESGAKLGGSLYSDQLSTADGPAGTYIDMVRHNIRVLTAALGG